MLAKRKEGRPDGGAAPAPHHRHTQRLPPNPSWTSSPVSSLAAEPLVGHGPAEHTMLGVIQPVISSGHAVQGGKGFQSWPSHISVRSRSLCHGRGLDHAMLLTPEPAEQGWAVAAMEREGQWGCHPVRPRLCQGPSLCQGSCWSLSNAVAPAQLCCVLGMATCRAWGLEGAKAGDAQERACHRGMWYRGLGWLKHPLLGVIASRPREAFQSPDVLGKCLPGAIQAS